MNWGELGSIALRTFVLYAAVLLVFRLAGKRSLSNMAPFDLIVVIMAGEAAAIALEDPARPLINGLVPVFVLGALTIAISLINMRNHKFEHVMQGKPATVVKNGQIDTEALTSEHMTVADLKALLHDKNVDDISTVKEARLEPTGKLTVTLWPEEKPLTERKLRQFVDKELEQRLDELLQRRLREVLKNELRETFDVRFGQLRERLERTDPTRAH